MYRRNMKYKTIRDADVKNKIVLVRADYNVPMKDGKITDDLRIRASLPTLEYLLEAGAKKIVIITMMKTYNLMTHKKKKSFEVKVN